MSQTVSGYCLIKELWWKKRSYPGLNICTCNDLVNLYDLGLFESSDMKLTNNYESMSLMSNPWDFATMIGGSFLMSQLNVLRLLGS